MCEMMISLYTLNAFLSFKVHMIRFVNSMQRVCGSMADGPCYVPLEHVTVLR